MKNRPGFAQTEVKNNIVALDTAFKDSEKDLKVVYRGVSDSDGTFKNLSMKEWVLH